MNKVAAIVLTLGIMIGLNLSCGDPTSPDISDLFEDPNFEALIREKLDMPSGEITAEDMLSITTLNGFFREITNISGIEYCVNLTELFIISNQITDIGPLSGLTNLTSLILNVNQINDTVLLSGLTNLTMLELNSNQISSITPLSVLTKLNLLSLSDNQIVDIKPLVDNTGLDGGDRVDLHANPLSDTSITVYIPQLRANGVDVRWE